MGTLGAIIGTIIFGAVIGMLARLALPGKQQISALLTVALGVAGALIGSAVWEALGGGPTATAVRLPCGRSSDIGRAPFRERE